MRNIEQSKWNMALKQAILFGRTVKESTYYNHEPKSHFEKFIEFLYGWIAGGWEAHFRNYRHFVSQCPVSTLDWLSNFPHKAWVDPGEGLFTCQVNRREWETNRDRLCSNRSPWPLYHGAYPTVKANKRILCWNLTVLNIGINLLSLNW